MPSMMRIANIKIGKRHRKDMGDIRPLAASIKEMGLLHPIVVTPQGSLIAGERRRLACKMNKMTEVPVTVIDLAAIVRGEIVENTLRKDFQPSEMAAIADTLESKERKAARKRMLAGKPSGKFPEGKGQTRDKLAAELGISGRTLDKIRAVAAAAKAEPKKYDKLVEAMDGGSSIEMSFRRLKIARQAEAIRREPPQLPRRGPYRVIVADPPWPFNSNASRRGSGSYPEMSIEAIRAFPVASIAHADCILWLWTTNYHMREAFTVLDAWGFEHKAILTWAKDRFGIGNWLRGQTEHCLLATRGKPTITLTNQTTLLRAPLRAHSEKPEEFYALVESLCPAPRYAELFARRGRDGWDCHGMTALLKQVA
jgi:N6-adenosine-specific RNA methylase IME4/ParB-like chromosome segregation protein Spo0J